MENWPGGSPESDCILTAKTNQPMPSPSIVVVGSANTDMIIQLDRIPRPGETVLGGNFSFAAGGKGANQAVGAARAGGAVTFVARVGRDMFGEQALAGFVKDGINVDFIGRDARAPSGVALIFVGRNGENSIAVAGGANANLSPADVRRAKRVIASASILVMQTRDATGDRASRRRAGRAGQGAGHPQPGAGAKTAGFSVAARLDPDPERVGG